MIVSKTFERSHLAAFNLFHYSKVWIESKMFAGFERQKD
jgi:hypothetical protein